MPEPSFAFAVIFTFLPFPAFFAVTFPADDTVAYFVLLLVQVRVLYAPAVAVIFAFNATVFPFFTEEAPVILIFVTIPFAILMVYLPLTLLPSFAVAVSVTVFPLPAFFVVTFPVDETVAYFVLLLFQVTALFAAFAGVTIALSYTDLPYATIFVALEIDILETFTGVGFGSGAGGFPSTFTSQLAIFVPTRL